MTAMAETLLDKFGLKIGRLKWLTNHLNGAFDMYCREFSALIVSQKNKEGYMKDVTDLHDLFFTWQSIPKEWKPGDPQWVDHADNIVFKPANKNT